MSDSLQPQGILQARIQKWVVFPFSRGSSQPRDQTQVSWIAGGFFTSWTTKIVQDQREKAKYAHSANGRVCPTYPTYSSLHIPIIIYLEPSLDFTANLIQFPACLWVSAKNKWCWLADLAIASSQWIAFLFFYLLFSFGSVLLTSTLLT